MTAAVAGVIAIPWLPIAPWIGGGSALGLEAVSWAIQLYGSRRRVAVIDPGHGRSLRLNQFQVARAQFAQDSTAEHPVLMVRPTTRGMLATPSGDWLRIEGSTTLPSATRVLAVLNHAGGSTKVVTQAAARLDHLPGDDRAFGHLAVEAANRKYSRDLGDCDSDFNLALEMAANEDTERVWLAGDLLDLEQAWRRAEELAAIADPLATEHLTDQLNALKNRRR